MKFTPDFQFDADYEPETTRVLSNVLKAGDSVLLAGAHQGIFATYAASLVGPFGNVYAFEPDDTNRGLLTENTKPFKNVKVYDCALGDRNKDALLYLNKDNSGGHALWNVAKHSDNVKTRENPSTKLVSVKTIDTLLEDEDLSKLKLILLDAEGAEHSILRGGINTIIDNDVPFIICEINDFAMENCGTSQMTIRGYMEMYGYKCFLLDVDGCNDMDPKNKLTCEVDGQSVVFNVLFSRKGKV